MFKSSKIESLPNRSGAMNSGALVNYFIANPVKVELTDGTMVDTCHLMADGRRFDIAQVFPGMDVWNYIYIKQFSFYDDVGNLQVVDVLPKHPHLVDHATPTTQCAHVTKINGLRWGVTIKVDLVKGCIQIIGDQDSPIIGCLFQLIE